MNGSNTLTDQFPDQRGEIRMKERLISSVPLFATIPPNELAQLAAELEQIDCPAGSILVREGAPGDGVYIVLSGMFEIIKELGSDEERLFGLRGAGEVVGEMGLLSQDGLRSASVRAVSDAQVIKLTRADFDRLLGRYPTIAYEMLRMLSTRLRDSNDAVIHELQEKNRQLAQAYADVQAQNQQLAQAYADLEAAQSQLMEKKALEHELRLARDIQERILPRQLPAPAGYDLGARMVAAREVGGDFFDVFPLGSDSLGLVVGDACGKGMPAALFMALTRSLLRAEAARAASPEAALRETNQHLAEISTAGMFITILYGILNYSTGDLTYARAGHELPLIWDAAGLALASARANGQPLGILPDPAIDVQRLRLPPGGTLLLFSDGVTEATNAQGGFFGLECVQATVRAHLGMPAQQLCDQLVDTLAAYRGTAPQADDITLLAVRAAPGR
jgi:serine phosphatase RsbU (regulator of sigma subunit)